MSVKKPPQTRKLSDTPSSLAASVDKKGGKDDKKKKLVVACMACRAKKVKCSSDKPACKNCLRLGVPCEYPLIRNRGSRFGYSGYLEKRLGSLENCLLSQDAKNGLSGVIKLVPVYPCQAQSQPPPQQPPPQHATPQPPSSVPPGHSPETPRYAESNASDESTLTIKLPSPELTDHFVSLYFKHIHNHTYSYLYRPHFEERIRNGTVNKALVYAVCGLCCRFSNHPLIEPGAKDYLGAQYITQARKLIRSQLEEPDIETVQASICVVQYEFFLANGSKSMIYIGLAIRMASHLSLFKELEGPELETSTWQERELRRRTWWSIVVLDRLAHGTNWTLLIPPEHFEVQLPCSREDFENNRQTRTVFLDGRESDIALDEDKESKVASPKEYEYNIFSLHILIVEAWSRVTKYANDGALRKGAKSGKNDVTAIKEDSKSTDSIIKEKSATPTKDDLLPWQNGSDFQTLASLIAKIQEKIPPHLQLSAENLQAATVQGIHGMFVHVHCVLQQTICTLYQTVYPLNTSLYTTKQVEAIPRCFIETAAINIVNSAGVISSVAQQLLHHNMVPAPFVGFCIFSTSPVHIANTFSQDTQTAAAAQHNLALNLRLLINLKDYWQVVSMWCSTIRERYSEKLQQVEGGRRSGKTEEPLIYNHHYTPTNAKFKSGEIDKRKVAAAAMRQKTQTQENSGIPKEANTWSQATASMAETKPPSVKTPSIPSTPVLMSVFTEMGSAANNMSFALPQALQSVSKTNTPAASPRTHAEDTDLNMLKNVLYPSFSNPPIYGVEAPASLPPQVNITNPSSPKNWDLFPELTNAPTEYGFHDLGEQWLRHFEIGVDDIQRVFPRGEEGYM
ncbi:fungal-specific transcription factor domain-domain-containing protein [Yarrowia lipolytica]|jgi:hypothetical protein|uniref:YALI0C15202p n=2 Tax=Yarrowia lipolytica TaxID=4952 RepID=Q6CBV4_YARLI|nr:YALI0C15202p [Yarrowia lipolytica CLIB122]AOW02907.1 hypothetical protein YALI1_C21448g [Yarrowia lipolytica]KAB8280430.1 fungal-specific transcription factor domain-containing protein [Yarrowia lipolytica]KAE8169519.1 fungal-specific transcription factor domain-containing protein [Yarrowia lipolytica]KAJ8053476.1 fungal-specific transcription factor domain-containing protein [Yarrowia lipolytica]QNP95850.1 Putative transcriptional regulatory protein [Yarrowia lipolytica]|eukprot:XP_501858.1 YALI0C15202p [Yarrowia lipolytica CLIB122]